MPQKPPPQVTLDTAQRTAEQFPQVVPYMRIVGAWVWVQFPTLTPGKDTTCERLKALGYHYSQRRNAWQHTCGIKSRKARKDYDPRQHYGNTPAAEYLCDCNGYHKEEA